MSAPHTIAPVLGDDVNVAETASKHPVEGNAPLHDHLQEAVGLEMIRCAGKELLELGVVLGDAAMQRRVGEDGIVGA